MDIKTAQCQPDLARGKGWGGGMSRLVDCKNNSGLWLPKL